MNDRRKHSLKLKLDLTNWELGDWPEQLESIIRFEWEGQLRSLEVSVDADALDAVTRKIATEAIEVFFNDFFPDMTDAGIEFYADEQGEDKHIVPWGSILTMLSPEGRDALVK